MGPLTPRCSWLSCIANGQLPSSVHSGLGRRKQVKASGCETKMTAAVYHVPSISYILSRHPSKQSDVAFCYPQCQVKPKVWQGAVTFPRSHSRDWFISLFCLSRSLHAKPRKKNFPEWRLLSRCTGAQGRLWALPPPHHPIYTYLADTRSSSSTW